MRLRTIAIIIAGISIASTLVDVAAQGYPGRGGHGGGSRESTAPRESRRDSPMPTFQDPFGALERELPSLKVDIMISAEQLDDWRVFERDVRDIAEMERARRRHLMALKDSGEKPPTTLTLIGSLTEDARLRAEAAQDLQRHLETLYAKLDDAQRRTLDRRTIQSQTDPLGAASSERDSGTSRRQ
jgi:hypothetical protein